MPKRLASFSGSVVIVKRPHIVNQRRASAAARASGTIEEMTAAGNRRLAKCAKWADGFVAALWAFSRYCQVSYLTHGGSGLSCHGGVIEYARGVRPGTLPYGFSLLRTIHAD